MSIQRCAHEDGFRCQGCFSVLSFFYHIPPSFPNPLPTHRLSGLACSENTRIQSINQPTKNPKLFTTILNNRLNDYIEVNDILTEAQTALRRGYLKRKKKKLFCAFIDFQKAFDMIYRSFLWPKIIIHNINANSLKLSKRCTMV